MQQVLPIKIELDGNFASEKRVAVSNEEGRSRGSFHHYPASKHGRVRDSTTEERSLEEGVTTCVVIDSHRFGH